MFADRSFSSSLSFTLSFCSFCCGSARVMSFALHKYQFPINIAENEISVLVGAKIADDVARTLNLKWMACQRHGPHQIGMSIIFKFIAFILNLV